MGRFEPPPKAFNNVLISVGKKDPGVGLTLVGTLFFKTVPYGVETHR